MDLFNLISLIGGLAFFLYGMNIMGSGLERVAGSKLEATLERFTNKVWKSVLFGALVTAAIQSSSATTVIVVGLVNSGLIRLRQAIGVIMGANIGTTVTSLILSLGDISSTSFFLQMLKPKNFAPVIAVIGILLIMGGKKTRSKDLGQVFMGFGILFTGMYTMEVAVSPLRDVPAFVNMLTAMQNPVFGVLAGALVTAIIQSSSASVGILQAISSTGSLTCAAAFPIIMGQNIGTCITPILASIGANKNAKRSAMVHLYFNIIGTILFLCGIYAIQGIWGFPFWYEKIGRAGIASFHVIFNIIVTLIFIPFTGLLEKLATATIRSRTEKGDHPAVEEVVLDDRLLSSPAIATQQCSLALRQMYTYACSNFTQSLGLIKKFDHKVLERINEQEDAIDRMESKLGNYLIKLSEKDLSEHESVVVTQHLHIVNEVERIGDYVMNIVERSNEMYDKGIVFSDTAYYELDAITDAVSEVLSLTGDAYFHHDLSKAMRVEPLEQTIDMMKEALKNKHIDRLRAGKCNVDAGIIFLEILTNLERLSDHCSNIAVKVIAEQKSPDGNFDPHTYLRDIHQEKDPDYADYLDYYDKKYYALLDKE